MIPFLHRPSIVAFSLLHLWKKLAPSSFFSVYNTRTSSETGTWWKKGAVDLFLSVLGAMWVRLSFGLDLFFSLDEHWLYLRVRCRVGCCGEGRLDAQTGKTKAPRMKSARLRLVDVVVVVVVGKRPSSLFTRLEIVFKWNDDAAFTLTVFLLQMCRDFRKFSDLSW